MHVEELGIGLANNSRAVVACQLRPLVPVTQHTKNSDARNMNHSRTLRVGLSSRLRGLRHPALVFELCGLPSTAEPSLRIAIHRYAEPHFPNPPPPGICPAADRMHTEGVNTLPSHVARTSLPVCAHYLG